VVTRINFIFPGKHGRSDDDLPWSELRIQPAAYAKAYNAAHTVSYGVTQKEGGPVTVSDQRCHPGYPGLDCKSNNGDQSLQVRGAGHSSSASLGS
jgi:hypothetical protein